MEVKTLKFPPFADCTSIIPGYSHLGIIRTGMDQTVKFFKIKLCLYVVVTFIVYGCYNVQGWSSKKYQYFTVYAVCFDFQLDEYDCLLNIKFATKSEVTLLFSQWKHVPVMNSYIDHEKYESIQATNDWFLQWPPVRCNVCIVCNVCRPIWVKFIVLITESYPCYFTCNFVWKVLWKFYLSTFAIFFCITDMVNTMWL